MTPRQIQIVKFLRRYFYARTAQIRDAVIPHDTDGSITREALRKMLQLGYVRRHFPKLLEDGKQTAPPIFVLTVEGSNALSVATGDCSLILSSQPTFSDWMSLNHYCALGSLHMKIDAAIQGQQYVRLHALFFEHEVINPLAQGGQRFKLWTQVSPQPVYCCPDSAMETEVAGYRRAWYFEYETGADGNPARVIARKHKGYHGLATSQMFKRHFPEARDSRVIAICPNAGWVQEMRKQIKGKPGSDNWLFGNVQEITAKTFLHGPLFYSAEKGPYPFVPNPGASSGDSPPAEKTPG